MQRTVSASIDLALSGPVRLIYSVAVAQGAPISSESLEITVDGTAEFTGTSDPSTVNTFDTSPAP